MNPALQNTIELRDIHLPDPVSWWPLATGWWILIVLFLALALVAYISIPKLIKKYNHQPARKLALIEFKNIQQEFHIQKNRQSLAQSLSVLLRRVCMTYDSRHNSASITGQAWINKLNSLNPQQPFPDDMVDTLLKAPYQKHHQFNAELLLSQCENWIKQLPNEAHR